MSRSSDKVVKCEKSDDRFLSINLKLYHIHLHSLLNNCSYLNIASQAIQTLFVVIEVSPTLLTRSVFLFLDCDGIWIIDGKCCLPMSSEYCHVF